MRKLLIKDFMIRAFESVTPEDDMTTAAKIMIQTKVDDLPVVDAKGDLIGIMTKSSLLDAVVTQKKPSTKIWNLFRKKVFVVYEEQTFEDSIDEVRLANEVSVFVKNADNELVGVITKTSWITALHEQEAFLSTQLSAVLHTMYNGLLTINSKQSITSLNRAAERILKTTEKKAAGSKLDAFLPGLELNRVLILGTPSIGIEYWRNELSLICNITPIINDNIITGAVIVFQDLSDLAKKITELESMTKLYRTLLSVMDIAYDGLVVVDEKSRIFMTNRSAAQFFRKQEKDMLGKPVEEIIENTKVREVVKTGLPAVNQLQFISGTPYVVSILPISQKGEIIGAVFKIVFRQLDEVKELATQLENADQQLAYYKEKSDTQEDDGFGFNQIITADPHFTKIKEECEIVARGASNILITGESGTGKELIAQAIHFSSPWSKGPLVKINCASIPENLLESEFFGYAPGAFSGAHKDGRMGKFALAEGGSLFLDEIGDMSLNLQSKLLRVLQDKRIEPVGSNKTITVNIRLITATNQDLESLVEQGRFRADLYYRLNVINFHLPPLRERHHDINLLVHFFLEKYNRIFGTDINKLSDATRQILLSHSWPGNVRELENVAERAINFARGDCIESDDLPLYLKEQTQSTPPPAFNSSSSGRLKSRREDIEKEEILAALDQAKGKKTKAAKILGISRSWLYSKMNRLDIQ